ncbi:hypothetical protein ACFX2K_036424 [Malus domestica]
MLVTLEENGRAPCKSALDLKATRARASGGSDGCVSEGLEEITVEIHGGGEKMKENRHSFLCRFPQTASNVDA